MGYLVTFLILLLACCYFGIVFWRANRRAARERRAAEEAAAKRRDQEKELLERLERIRKADDLGRAKRAVERDPARAARVVSKMMRDRG